MRHCVSICASAALFAAAACSTASAGIVPTVWSGLTYTFINTGGTNPNDAASQDRITDNVWITRGFTQGIFNIAQEASYDGAGANGPSPVGTEWAFGTTANYASLTYTPWAQAHGGNPGSLVGQNMVLHLIADNIYLDIRFDRWGPQGGGFTYIRAVPTPGAAAALGLGTLIAAGRRRR